MTATTYKKLSAVVLALLAAGQLAACSSSSSPTALPPGNGGGGNSDGGTGGGTGGGDETPALSIGVFVDAPVAGLSYETSSGHSSTTDAAGRYEYEPGDTVTFSLGELVLGTVTGQSVVTPMTVAEAIAAEQNADPETVAVNLLVLLQSLDENGDPSDGISLTPALRDAVVAGSIDLTADESTFTTVLTTFVANVAASADLDLEPVTREAAVDHFLAHIPTAMAGTYVRADEAFAPITQKAVTLTLLRNGRYLLGGQHDTAECDLDPADTPVSDEAFSDPHGNGVEHGAYTWNPLTRAFAVSDLDVETDGYCGLNKPVEGAQNDITKLEATAEGLVFKDEDDNVAYRFVRVEPTEGLGGAWLQPTSMLLGEPFAFTFFPSSSDELAGRYLMVDASFGNDELDTSPGIEEGCYSVDDDVLTVELNSTVCEDAIDTNDTAGLSDDVVTLELFVDENDRLVVADGEDVTTFTRASLEPITYDALAGSWLLQTSEEGELADQPQLFMLTVLDDGRFLFGTQENNPACVPGDYPAPTEADGNGLELGQLSLTAAPGLVVPVPSVDSNGECGLYDAKKGFQQQYLVVPNAARDALAVWSNDDDDAAGVVFKRVPSVAGGLTGAWLWEEGDEIAVVAYLPGGVMFENSVFADESGLLRESFTIEGSEITSTAAGYEYCVDTVSTWSSCLDDPDEVTVETFSVDGDTLTYDDFALTRIPAN